MLIDERVRKLLVFLADYFDSNGFWPSMREIADGLGVSSTSVIGAWADLGIKTGYLTQWENRSRTLRPTQKGKEYLVEQQTE